MMGEIIKALKDLGVTGAVTIKQISFNRFAIYVDGEYFGIWDIERRTFVD